MKVIAFKVNQHLITDLLYFNQHLITDLLYFNERMSITVPYILIHKQIFLYVVNDKET